jgi:hypothetical protein
MLDVEYIEILLLKGLTLSSSKKIKSDKLNNKVHKDSNINNTSFELFDLKNI